MKRSKSSQRFLRAELGRLDVVPLRLLARRLAAGHQLGMHHAQKKGAGLEFLGQREYVPGDDLRHLDHRALLRHGRYLVREFQVETERPLHLIVDSSPSMAFADAHSPLDAEGVRSKLDLARLLTAASTILARRAGDPVGLTYGDPAHDSLIFLKPRAGSEQVERIFHTLEEPVRSPGPEDAGDRLESAVLETGSRLPRGAIVFWFSDFLDPVESIAHALSLLTSRKRTVVLVQILTRAERDFPFHGPHTFKDPESPLQIECDSEAARVRYLERLSAHEAQLLSETMARGATLLCVRTDEDPRRILQNLVALASGRMT